MLSAVVENVQKCREKTRKQADNIEDIRNKISGPLTTETDSFSSVGDIKEILLRVSSLS